MPPPLRIFSMTRVKFYSTQELGYSYQETIRPFRFMNQLSDLHNKKIAFLFDKPLSDFHNLSTPLLLLELYFVSRTCRHFYPGLEYCLIWLSLHTYLNCVYHSSSIEKFVVGTYLIEKWDSAVRRCLSTKTTFVCRVRTTHFLMEFMLGYSDSQFGSVLLFMVCLSIFQIVPNCILVEQRKNTLCNALFFAIKKTCLFIVIIDIIIMF